MADWEQWLRLIQNATALFLVMPAAAICAAMWWEQRHLYLVFGAATFLALAPLLILRIAAVPDPPMLEQKFIADVSLVVNAIWPLLGLAWLVAFLAHRWRKTRLAHLRHKYFDEVEGE